jgi:hypothetical protein
MIKLKLLTSIGLLLLAVALTGCTSVATQNVISSINTGIGISLAENPQTQLYEAKLGYIRSQFYSVPTGKTLCDSSNTNCVAKNDADKAVTLLAGIRVSSSLQHLFLGADITESFAIGCCAVDSPAAVAMYVSQAKSEGRAQSAADAGKYVAEAKAQVTAENADLDKALDWLYGQGAAATPKPDPAKLTTFLKGSRFEQNPDLVKDLPRSDLSANLKGKWHLDWATKLKSNVPSL